VFFTGISRAVWLNILTILLIILVMILVVAVIIFVETGQRRLPVQYAKRVVGRKIYGGQSTHLPLKLNTSGVIPPIFASSILLFPTTIANFLPKEWVQIHPWVQSILESLNRGGILYNVLDLLLFRDITAKSQGLPA
jgi:preprotein translocase subunit SecY